MPLCGEICPAEIGAGQVSAVQVGIRQLGTAQAGSAQFCTNQVSLVQLDRFQVCSLGEIHVLQDRVGEVCPAKVGVFEYRTALPRVQYSTDEY